MTHIQWDPSHPALRRLLAVFAQFATPVYVVGGVVRDLVLGRADADMADVDLLVATDALSTARRAANAADWAFYPLDATRDVARLVYKDRAQDGETSHLICDVTALNGKSLADDLAARDFTMNAMAFTWNGRGQASPLIDPYGGAADLAARRLRWVTEHSLSDDPLRLVRAVRLAAQFGLDLDEPLRAQIRRLAGRIHDSSPERLRDEVWKALATTDPAAVLTELHALTLLEKILPEVARTVGVWRPLENALGSTTAAKTDHSPTDVFHHTVHTVSRAAWWRDWLLHGDDAAHATTGDAAQDAPLLQMGQTTLASLRPQLTAHFAQQLTPERSRAQWLVWHALFHALGMAKPNTQTSETVVDDADAVRADHAQVSAGLTRQRLHALRFSRDEIVLSSTVVREQGRLWALHHTFRGAPLDRRTCYRFFHAAGGRRAARPPGVDIVLLALAEHLAAATALRTVPDRADDERLADWHEFLAHARQLLDYAFAPDGLRAVQQQPLVNGHLLMTRLGIEAGRQLGQLLDHLAEAQAAGDIQTTEEAVQHAAQWLKGQSG